MCSSEVNQCLMLIKDVNQELILDFIRSLYFGFGMLMMLCLEGTCTS